MICLSNMKHMNKYKVFFELEELDDVVGVLVEINISKKDLKRNKIKK